MKCACGSGSHIFKRIFSSTIMASTLNDEPGLTFTYFTARPICVSYAFIWGKLLERQIFPKLMGLTKHLQACGMKIGITHRYNCFKLLRISLAYSMKLRFPESIRGIFDYS